MAQNELAGYGLFSRTAEQLDKEILYSAHGILKKGGVIASGQVLATGTVLGLVTATGKWKAYNNANSDGTEVAAAILARAVDASGGDQECDIYFAGIFKTATLVGLDAAGITDFGAKQNAVYGYTIIPS